MENRMTITISARSENEAFARSAVAAFCIPLSPTVDQINEIKTAVSEAVTNAVVHAYDTCEGEIFLSASYGADGVLHITVKDEGRGIPCVKQAMQPFYTTGEEEERSGMGFTIMRTFTDDLKVDSTPGGGTVVRMQKRIGTAAGDVE